MIKVGIIGSGRVAHHLCRGFLSQKATDLLVFKGIYARNASKLPDFVPSEFIVTQLEDFASLDVVLIAVADDAIPSLSESLPFSNVLVAHTSGSTSIHTLADHHRKGVFYPLQTFSKDKNVDWQSVPIALEAFNESDYSMLHTIASALSGTILRLSSEQRLALHVSAVFVANFVNHMYVLGSEICKQHQIPFDLLQPLIKETAEKVIYLTPKEAQTGPAIRFDEITINKHLEFLKSFPEGLKAYTLLTQSIQHGVDFSASHSRK